MSGPLLDRIDVHVALPPVEASVLGNGCRGEGSEAVRARVWRARGIQRDRAFRGDVTGLTNATLPAPELHRVARPCNAGSRLLATAVQRLAFSARAYTKVLRVARTIADLSGSAAIAPEHLAEAIALRVLDRPVLAAA
jgi:magnesium chelatase family protein